ncbi:MAG: MATE family efflux transporter [Bacillota bacterium]|nr:MATE family efflux transporter [Bacillota bacterium]
MSKKTGSAIDMTSGSPHRLLLAFSVPLLAGNVLQQLYNTVDSLVVGNFLGREALAAVGSGFPFLFMLTALFMGIAMGGAIIVSQYFGARDYDSLQRTVGTIYRLLPLLVLPISVAGVIFARPVLSLLRVPDDGTLNLASIYLQVIFAGLIGSMGYNINAGLLQGIGDGVSSLKFLSLATLINIVLDLIFVLVFHWGVFGVALATVIAQWISWILGVFYINRRYDYISIRPRQLEFDRDIFRRALKLGIPSGMQQMVFSLGSMLMSALINSYGSAFMAGFTSAGRIDSFVFMPIQSFSMATTTYIGQNVGAQRLDRVSSGMRAALALGMGTGLALGLGLYPLRHVLMRLFSDDELVIAYGANYLQNLLPFYFILAFLFTVNSVLRGSGQTFIPMISSFISMLIVRIPTAYLISRLLGPDYLYYSYVIGWVAGSSVSFAYYHFSGWRERLQLDMVKTPLTADREAECSS